MSNTTKAERFTRCKHEDWYKITACFLWSYQLQKRSFSFMESWKEWWDKESRWMPSEFWRQVTEGFISWCLTAWSTSYSHLKVFRAALQKASRDQKSWGWRIYPSFWGNTQIITPKDLWSCWVLVHFQSRQIARSLQDSLKLLRHVQTVSKVRLPIATEDEETLLLHFLISFLLPVF